MSLVSAGKQPRSGLAEEVKYKKGTTFRLIFQLIRVAAGHTSASTQFPSSLATDPSRALANSIAPMPKISDRDHNTESAHREFLVLLTRAVTTIGQPHICSPVRGLLFWSIYRSSPLLEAHRRSCQSHHCTTCVNGVVGPIYLCSSHPWLAPPVRGLPNMMFAFICAHNHEELTYKPSKSKTRSRPRPDLAHHAPPIAWCTQKFLRYVYATKLKIKF